MTVMAPTLQNHPTQQWDVLPISQRMLAARAVGSGEAKVKRVFGLSSRSTYCHRKPVNHHIKKAAGEQAEQGNAAVVRPSLRECCTTQ